MNKPKLAKGKKKKKKARIRRIAGWSLFFLLGMILGLSGESAQQTAPAQPPQYAQQPASVSLEKITDRVYQVSGGSGANCAVVIGPKETMVIDAKMNPESARQMLAEIGKISPSPIGILVLTHSDGDHVNGLTGFPEGIKIIAHEQTKKNLEEAFQDERARAYVGRIETISETAVDYDLGGENVRRAWRQTLVREERREQVERGYQLR